ncbi:MAG: hypothetical protein JXQ72_15765 [Anaerolineae bacterium]|nr:hypothetical protein [Anaerolineae bacterium]
MSRRHRTGPSPLLIILVGALLVFGGYYVWMGFVSFLEDSGDITAPVTRQAFATSTAAARPQIPTVFNPATFTPLPPCQEFKVSVDRAVYRECPSQDNRECPIVEVVPYGTEFCVYARVPNNPEWWVIELNPGGAYRDIVYMHESVLEPVNPTLTPSITFTPLPTVTAAPSDTPTPTPDRSPTATRNPNITPTPLPTVTPQYSPTPTPTLTPVRITI